jgi:phosphatidylinositol kinase/protein kinase (PI-3  family)
VRKGVAATSIASGSRSSSGDTEGVGGDDGLNERALDVIERISAKLRGKDFKTKEPLDVPAQVQRLIEQATSTENLCQCYHGWCPFW